MTDKKKNLSKVPDNSPKGPGKLYVVATPIGNLEDITLRAIRVLKEVDLILAEDTRTSGRLLKHLGIANKLLSYHIHNEHKSILQLADRILNGESMALISDAGTPAISDPGFLLVRECIKNNIEVDCLPGPTAFVPALVNSGFERSTPVFSDTQSLPLANTALPKRLSP